MCLHIAIFSILQIVPCKWAFIIRFIKYSTYNKYMLELGMVLYKNVSAFAKIPILTVYKIKTFKKE